MTDEPVAESASEGVLDGNASAGALAMAFGLEMTAVSGRCAHCGAVHVIGELRAYTRAPGIVLRCPACDGIILRVVETPEATFVDVRGAAYLRFEHR